MKTRLARQTRPAAADDDVVFVKICRDNAYGSSDCDSGPYEDDDDGESDCGSETTLGSGCESVDLLDLDAVRRERWRQQGGRDSDDESVDLLAAPLVLPETDRRDDWAAAADERGDPPVYTLTAAQRKQILLARNCFTSMMAATNRLGTMLNDDDARVRKAGRLEHDRFILRVWELANEGANTLDRAIGAGINEIE
jgi:hypothetical protein